VQCNQGHKTRRENLRAAVCEQSHCWTFLELGFYLLLLLLSVSTQQFAIMCNVKSGSETYAKLVRLVFDLARKWIALLARRASHRFVFMPAVP